MRKSARNKDSKQTLGIQVLNGLRLVGRSDDILNLASKKAGAILAYLALVPEASETRERLAGLLWSGSSEEQARASLRQCLKQLRALFTKTGFDGFSAERGTVSLQPSLVKVDLHDITENLEAGRLPERLLKEQCDPQRILYGYEDLDQAFASWLHVVRQNWQDRIIDSLQTLMRSDTTKRSQQAAEALARIDPSHEEAQRVLIRGDAEAGNVAAALRQYKLLWDYLGEEFDMEPEAETQALIATIKSGPPGQPPVETGDTAAPQLPLSATSRVQPQKSILPVIMVSRFVQGGPWQQEDYLMDGFRRELTASLVRFREWVVMEADQSFAPGELGTDLPPLSYQLEGTYFEEAGAIRVIVTLKDVSTSQYIWSEKLSLTPEAWGSARQKIIQRTSMAMNVYLSAQRLNVLDVSSTLPPDLYDRWLRAQQLSFMWRPESHREALELLNDLVRLAPEFAPAYSSMAEIENTRPLVFPGIKRSEKRDTHSLELAKRAVLLDPINTRTQLCLAWSQANVGQHDQASLSFRLAYELNENDPWTATSSALGLTYCGELEQGAEMADRALSLGVELSPVHWGYQAGVRFMLGDYEACIEASGRSQGSLLYLPAWKCAAFALSGDLDAAKDAGQRFIAAIAQNWFGEGEPTELAISDWLLDIFPIRDDGARERLRAGLQHADIPVPD